MICVTRLDGKPYWINPHLIESMEQNPDLTVTFLSGKKIVLKDSPEQLIQRVIEYRKKLNNSTQEL